MSQRETVEEPVGRPPPAANAEGLRGLVRAAAADWYGADPGAGALAEALRAELWARRTADGRRLAAAALALARPLGDPGADPLAVLGELIDAGDVTEGPGGRVAAAPLHLVGLSPGEFAVAGTTPTRLLRGRLPGDLRGGLGRRLTTAAGGEPGLAAALAGLGGREVSAERWAGLDRAPAAGPEWLARLDERLGVPEDGRPLPDVLRAAAWRALKPPSSWTGSPGGPARLWRARDDRGGWWHAWTGGAAPPDGPCLLLGRDEAARAVFAAARAAGRPVPWREKAAGAEVEVEPAAFLPAAEYRYLLTLGRREEGGAWGPRFRVPAAAWAGARGVLAARLGWPEGGAGG